MPVGAGPAAWLHVPSFGSSLEWVLQSSHAGAWQCANGSLGCWHVWAQDQTCCQSCWQATAKQRHVTIMSVHTLPGLWWATNHLNGAPNVEPGIWEMVLCIYWACHALHFANALRWHETIMCGEMLKRELIMLPCKVVSRIWWPAYITKGHLAVQLLNLDMWCLPIIVVRRASIWFKLKCGKFPVTLCLSVSQALGCL